MSTKDNIRTRYDKGGKVTGYQAIIREKDHNGKLISTSKTFTKKAHAKTWRAKTVQKIKNGEFEPESILVRTKVKDMMEFWIQSGVTNKHKDGGVRMTSIKGHVNAKLGEETLASLDSSLITNNYVKKRYEEDGAATATIRKELSYASLAWKLYAFTHKIKKDDPFKDACVIIKITKYLEPEKPRDRRPTQDEFSRILNFPEDSIMLSLVEFAALEGMRRGEISRMKRSHLVNDILSIPETKTDKPRKIKLFPRSLEILKSLPVRLDGFFFGLTKAQITYRFIKIVRALEIKDLRFHDLRHEACSRMGDMHMQISDIAAKSGHADWNMLRTYTQLNPSEDAKAYALKMAGLDSPGEMQRFGIAG